MPGIIFNNIWNYYYHLPHWTDTVVANERINLGSMLLDDTGSIWTDMSGPLESQLRARTTVDALKSNHGATELVATGYSRQVLNVHSVVQNGPEGWYQFSSAQDSKDLTFGSTVSGVATIQGILVYMTQPVNAGGISDILNPSNDGVYAPLYLFEFANPKPPGDAAVTVEFNEGTPPGNGILFTGKDINA